MALVSPEGRWLKVNRAICAVVGYSEAELLARSFQDITHPEDLDAALDYMRRMIDGEIRSCQMEKRYIHARGQPITVRLSVSLVRDSQGLPRYFISQIQDITEHKRAEDELRWKTAFLEAQVDSALDGIMVVDGQGRKILQNRRHRALWKTPAHLAENNDYAEQLQFFTSQTKNPGEFSAKVAYLYAHPDEVSRDEVALIDGTILDRYSSPVRDKLGKHYGRIWTFRDITDRKRMENDLRESYANFQQLADNITDVFWIRSPELRELHYVSPAFEQIWGRSVESLYANPHQWADFISPPDRERVLAAFAALAGKNAPNLDIEYRIVRPDAEIRWVRARGFQVRDAAGKTIRLTGIVTDITERKRAEDELRWKTAFLEAQVDSALDGILVVDGQRKVILQNERLRALWKIPPEVTRNYSDQLQFVLGRTKNPEEFVKKVDYLYAHPDEVSRDEIVLVDGTILDRYSSPVRDGAGTYYGRIWTFRDITERKRAQGELRRREERFGLLIEYASDLITILNGEGLIRFQSPSAKRLLGYEPEDLVGRNAFEFVHPADASRAAEALKRALTDSSAPVSVEYRVRHQDGTWRVLQSIGRNIPNEAPDGFVVINARDVTESRDLEAKFRQAQKMEAFGQLASGVAHDFNNILAVILVLAGLLRHKQAPGQAPMDIATEIENAAERGANLTRQLLLFSQRQTPQPRDFDLNGTITHIAKMLHRILGEDVQMQFKFAPQALFIHADAGMMDQILLNLTVNARDAMPKGGQLIVETHALDFDEITVAQIAQARLGSFVCLSVTDTGCGIPAENLPRIFEPFFTTKDVGKGTGLGLATVFGIVQQHRGWINVRSEIGQGTTFRVYLPRLTGVFSQPDARSPLAIANGSNETILLVEDDSALRAATKIVLLHLGYRVLEAPDGAAALEVWQRHRGEINLLLTDLVMPGGMTGRELAGRLLPQDPKLRVLYVSGYSAETADEDFRLAEGENFLTKPFEARRLAQTLRNCLENDQRT